MRRDVPRRGTTMTDEPTTRPLAMAKLLRNAVEEIDRIAHNFGTGSHVSAMLQPVRGDIQHVADYFDGLNERAAVLLAAFQGAGDA